MFTYIICYDLAFPGGDYRKMEEAIRSISSDMGNIFCLNPGGDAEKYQRTTWVVSTDQYAVTVFNELRKVMRPHDKLLVAEMGFGLTSHPKEIDFLPPSWLQRYSPLA